jgi:hypothetical protein
MQLVVLTTSAASMLMAASGGIGIVPLNVVSVLFL